jgi:(1->4)-alpha-D-glucan 1-alpha-D-glucosylmutase
MNLTEICDRLLSEATAAAVRRALPESTYRLQFHAGFTFRDATSIVPYLHALGVTHCYASPYLKARPGSTHGYDIIDHSALNPEIGTPEDYEQWISALHDHGMGQILDTVPNHMGVGTSDNPWWNDVLENGPAARFAPFFDIAWQSSPRPELRDKVLLPVLADLYGDVLEAGELTLVFADGAFSVHYGDRRFPIDPRSYDVILSHQLDLPDPDQETEGPAFIELQSILTAIRNLPGSSETEPEKVAERQREKEVIKRRLAAVSALSQAMRDHVDGCVSLYNARPGDPSSLALMDDLLERQSYRLSYWRVGSDEINYRRFFDINDLAALAVERDDVFEAAHALVLRLVAEGKVDGLRIDHPDGLFDPAAYLRKLQEQAFLARARYAFAADPAFQTADWQGLEPCLRERIASSSLERGDGHPELPLYVVVEKILGARESLVAAWPVHGTSGYDFLNQAGGVLVDRAHAGDMSRIYEEFTQEMTRFTDLVYNKKSLIMQVSLASELHMLTHQLDRMAQKSRRSRDFTFNTLRSALQEVIACFPVYRPYIDAAGASSADRGMVQAAVRRARMRNPLASVRVFRFIADMLLEAAPESASDEERSERRRFAGKFQQVTAPVMAKGVEDTAFYIDNRLVSLNEVGGDPAQFGTSPEALHAYNRERQARWPYALSPLSTHDTKRSEDVRARINVLSEIPGEWREAVRRWQHTNAPQRRLVDDQSVPDSNEEYLLYQTLVGAWPLEKAGTAGHTEFTERINAYMLKALHEAKVHTSWINPDPGYDQAIQEFVRLILDEGTSGAFLDDFRTFQRRVSHVGLFNSLSQTLLKLASPGVPDTYQGSEIWDFSLVDPDNRRPVDYQKRSDLLRQLHSAVESANGDLREFCRELITAKEDGRAKLYVHHRTLVVRRDHPGLLSAGEYAPLSLEGDLKDHVFAFGRRSEDAWVVVAVPRLLASLISDKDEPPLGQTFWQDTRLVLPDGLPLGDWRNIFTGEPLSADEHDGRRSLPAAGLFAHFPVALLTSAGVTRREA